MRVGEDRWVCDSHPVRRWPPGGRFRPARQGCNRAGIQGRSCALEQPLTIEVRGELYDAATGRQEVSAQALRKADHTGEGLAFIAYTLDRR